eukprot:scaffold186078_cov18-Tisochrysis_lutea.AAC.2
MKDSSVVPCFSTQKPLGIAQTFNADNWCPRVLPSGGPAPAPAAAPYNQTPPQGKLLWGLAKLRTTHPPIMPKWLPHPTHLLAPY